MRTKSFEDRRNHHEDRIGRVGRGQPAAYRHLPPLVQDALGELAGAAKEGLLALSVASGSRCCRGCRRSAARVSRLSKAFAPHATSSRRDFCPTEPNRLWAAHITYNRMWTPSVLSGQAAGVSRSS